MQNEKDLYIFKAYCSNVVDGDTVDLEIDLGFDILMTKRIRLLRINTPERGKAGFLDAKLYVVDELLEQECLVQTYKSDSFGRYLAEIFLIRDSGLVCLNDVLLEKGFAEPY